MNDWYRLVPCIHRIHDPDYPPEPGSAHHIQKTIGMSISLEYLIARLKSLEAEVLQQNDDVGLSQKVLVSFDDGYRDVLLLRSFFRDHKIFQPVLFVSSELLSKGIFVNWFDTLYDIAASKIQKGESPKAVMEWLDTERPKLRGLLHERQMDCLAELADGSLVISDELYLTLADISQLNDDGFLIGSHGRFHHDLTLQPDGSLRDELEVALMVCKTNDCPPWLAWPDGCFDDRTRKIAKQVGFELLFDIDGSNNVFSEGGLVCRSIW